LGIPGLIFGEAIQSHFLTKFIRIVLSCENTCLSAKSQLPLISIQCITEPSEMCSILFFTLKIKLHVLIPSGELIPVLTVCISDLSPTHLNTAGALYFLFSTTFLPHRFLTHSGFVANRNFCPCYMYICSENTRNRYTITTPVYKYIV